MTELTCAICLSLYDQPMLLTCMHTFCKQCLRDLVEVQSDSEDAPRELKCPTCREPTLLTITEGSDPLEKLPVNYIAKQLTVPAQLYWEGNSHLLIHRKCSEETKSNVPSARR